MKTVLITGCSSGYGLETARHFHSHGWNVVATMRNPRDGILPSSDRVHLIALDVTKPESISAAIEASGPIDVLVNNAGIGVVGAFEATPMAHIRKVFETNTFGVMAMAQAVIPQFRARRSGIIVNVTSSVTLAPMPLAAAYTASKMAIEGFTGSLAHELAGIQRARQAGRAGLWPDHALRSKHRRARRRPDPRGLCGLRPANLRRVRKTGHGDKGVGRGRGDLAGRQRCHRPASVPCRPRRRRVGARKLTRAVGAGGQGLSKTPQKSCDVGITSLPIWPQDRQHLTRHSRPPPR